VTVPETARNQGFARGTFGSLPNNREFFNRSRGIWIVFVVYVFNALLEENWLSGCIIGIAKIAQPNAD
jgi:hypothetical protein